MRPVGPTAHTSSAPKPYTSRVPCHSTAGTVVHRAPSKCQIPTQFAMYTSLADDPHTPAFPCPPVGVGVHTYGAAGSRAGCSGARATGAGDSTVSVAVAHRPPLLAVTGADPGVSP